jgi:hypothetical protein
MPKKPDKKPDKKKYNWEEDDIEIIENNGNKMY